MISEKFVRKYMRMAKQFGEDSNSCYSRQIGTVIVDPNINKVVGTGYNSPPRSTPHCDSHEYLEEVVWPQLTMEEKTPFIATLSPYSDDLGKSFADKYACSKQCPRKIIGCKSGQRLELCSCAHSETNAIINASQSLVGAYMFAYCGVPCAECSKLIINAGIAKVYCIDWGADYSFASRFLFEKAGVDIIMHKPEYYLEQS